ncbi:unnamed protein product [Dibothriocephalus latus]|uniref:Uncharacterized protein n=1 Tax=Dibothriocephalus latus TaxID=60516 RepID=A0A3P7MPL6_DIBLA|nr:unnamed protein product [Dibothriocephalus latus]
MIPRFFVMLLLIATSKAHVIINDDTQWEKVEFLVGTLAKTTATIEELKKATPVISPLPKPTATYAVDVEADIVSSAQVLKLKGKGEGKKLELTMPFTGTCPTGSASWMSHSVTVILASLAVVHVLQ